MKRNAATFRVQFGFKKRATNVDVTNPLPASRTSLERLARQLALAVAIERAIEDGKVKDYAEAAKLLRVTRARVAQVADLMELGTEQVYAVLGSAESEFTQR